MLNKFWLPLSQKMWSKASECNSRSPSHLVPILAQPDFLRVCKQNVSWTAAMPAENGFWLTHFLFLPGQVFFFLNCFCKQGITDKKIFCRNMILENPSHNCKCSQWSSSLQPWLVFLIPSTSEERNWRLPVTYFYPWHSAPHPKMRAQDRAAGRGGNP